MARHHTDKRALRLRTAVIFAIIAVLAVYAYIRMSDRGEDKPDERVALAQCLSEKGAKFYGAYWCPHCAAQKKAFGKSIKYVNYIECAIPGDAQAQTQVCKDAGITGYPTWVFADGSRLSGEVSLVSLAEKTGCPYPGAETEKSEIQLEATGNANVSIESMPAPTPAAPAGPRVDTN